MTYDFLIDSYDTERIKVLGVWSEFRDEDLDMRPRQDDPRIAFGRALLRFSTVSSVAAPSHPCQPAGWTASCRNARGIEPIRGRR